MNPDKKESGKNQSRKGLLYADMRTYTRLMADQHKNELVQMIPEQYNSIGDGCFKNNGKMKEVWLPLGCKIIEREAFYGCHIRKEVILPGTLTEIQAGAFAENCTLPQVRFPASVRKLGAQCYKGCNNLKAVRFESGSRCTEIPEGAFEGCTKLSELTLPEETEIIGIRAFYKCKELKNVQIPETVARIGEQAFYFCKLEELQLPEGLQELGDKAFFKCNGLKSVLIPESVQKIGEGVFHGCNRLEYLEIHHDPEEIGPGIVNKSCMIRCRKGSRVEAYCEENGLKTEYIDER